MPGLALVNYLLLLVAILASSCVSKPDLPAEIRKETHRIQIGRENIAVDFYYRPGGKSQPMAVVVHGFLANKERMAHWGAALAREGFVAALPNNPTRANDERNTSSIVGLVQAGRSGQWPVDAKTNGRVVLVGFSRGGFETLLATAQLGDTVDAWVGLDPVDLNGKGRAIAANVRVPGLALLADPAPLNADGNARAMLSCYAGSLEVARVSGAGHLDAESPGRNGKFVFFEERVLRFLRKIFPSAEVAR